MKLKESEEREQMLARLEERVCICGCEKKFRVLPESDQQHSSKWCKEGQPVTKTPKNWGNWDGAVYKGRGRKNV